jgi:predicted enzyme related to lactoylglutathione lyase
MDAAQLVFNLNSEHPDALRAFYRDIVRLKPHPDMGEGALIAATTPFIIDSHSALSGRAREPARTIFNFMVDDLVREQARMEAAGARFLTNGGTPATGQISFSTFVDPDGNYGQIFQGDGFPAGTEMFAVMRHSGEADRLRDFFRNVLGLSDDFPHLGNPFMAGETAIYIGSHSEVHGAARESARTMLNLFVGDLAAEQKRLEDRGVTFIRSAGKEYWGGVISTFVDPDGNYLQLIEFRP